MALEPSRFGDYALLGPLGSGATARVFEARHIPSGNLVAIKMLDTTSRTSKELRDRLAREAVLLTEVKSPYVAKLLGVGWDDDQPFLVLERLEGETLADLLKRDGNLATPQLVEYAEQLLIGIRDCHTANIIHRDIKPSNIFIETKQTANGVEERKVKLIDFGVARLNELVSTAGVTLTSSNHLIGSMGYMAPEQLEYAKGVGPEADLYAIGVVLFRCVSGRLPFVGRSFEALTQLKCESDAPLVSTMPGVRRNDLMDEFISRALQRKPEHRFATATEMLEAWWRVTAGLDREPASAGVEVDFDNDESGTLTEVGVTLVEPAKVFFDSVPPETARDAAGGDTAAERVSPPSRPVDDTITTPMSRFKKVVKIPPRPTRK